MVDLRQSVTAETWAKAVAEVGPPESVATSIAATLREALEASDDSARWRRGLLTVALLAAAAAEAATLAELEEGELRRVDPRQGCEACVANKEDGPDHDGKCARHIVDHAAIVEELKTITKPHAQPGELAIETLLRILSLPCGHTVADLIGADGGVTKCGACLAERGPREARHVARFRATTAKRDGAGVDDALVLDALGGPGWDLIVHVGRVGDAEVLVSLAPLAPAAVEVAHG